MDAVSGGSGASEDGFAEFGVRRRDADGVVVLAVTGALDIVTSDEFLGRLREVLGENPAAVIVDLGNLEFLGSAGIAALIDGDRLAGPDTAMAVVADGPATGRPLMITGVTDLIAVYRSLPDAIAGLRA